jgi:uncharacterized membrane protein YeaQ/YmgE (transglycosylase-associated protein family)
MTPPHFRIRRQRGGKLAVRSVGPFRACSLARMEILPYLILLALSGLFVGALARLALPGRDPMTIWQTILVGIAGSFAGGLLLWLLFGRARGNIVVSIAFATLIVYFIRRSRGGSLTDPGRRRFD